MHTLKVGKCEYEHIPTCMLTNKKKIFSLMLTNAQEELVVNVKLADGTWQKNR